MKIPFSLAVLPRFLFLFALLPVSGFPARADEYQGAAAILEQVDARSGPPDGKAAGAVSPSQHLRADAARFREQAASLAPEEAARAWLVLFDRAVKIPPSARQLRYDEPALPAIEIFGALPPPAAWDALASQVAARPPGAPGTADPAAPTLRIVTGMLQGKFDVVRAAIDALRSDDSSQARPYLASQLRATLAVVTGDRETTVKEFERKIAVLRGGAELSAADATERESLLTEQLEVPNLVALAGPARAEKLLKDGFSSGLGRVEIKDARTKLLARKVVLEIGDQLKAAPWNLVDNLDSTALYEMLVRRFPDTNPNDRNQRESADGYYLLGLIAKGRVEDATRLALKMGKSLSNQREETSAELPEEALNELAMQGGAKPVFDFFDRLLTAHPELPYWQDYTAAAVLAGETDAMLVKVKAASELADLKPRSKAALRKAYGEALLAADRVAEALPILRETASASEEGMDQNSNARQEVRARLRLANLGELLGDDTLLNEQLDAVLKIAKSGAEAADDDTEVLDGSSASEIFLAAKRGPDLERVLVANLVRLQRGLTGPRAALEASRMEDDYYRYQVREPLGDLVGLYAQAGRDGDVVTLLDRAKEWGEGDLAKLLGRLGPNQAFFVRVARALQKTGRADAALRIVDASLERNGGNDSAYALLLELLPPDRAEARLNELFQSDQFQERPLIWRAVVQLGQNRLDEAEKSARQAIAIDPSDGEEGRGDRMRAYAVLADILERKGDAAQAAQMRQAVKAIRLSEDADRFHEVGLLSRAVGMYEKALGYFSNAYCIQSRLAIQLTALGKMDEAMAHYERAYELMPESFGRMESHCFGCERAFAGVRAQATAERVFQRLVAKQPDNPRLHYLLGYLRMEEERSTEAAQEYREAVRLDPDYINAWKQLASVTDSASDRDRATLNLLRLDPRRQHDSANLETVSDLRSLWGAVEAAAKFALPEAKALYPLPASKAFREELRRGLPAPSPDDAPASSRYGNRPEGPFEPRAVILRNTVIVQALRLLSRNGDY